MQVSRLKEDNVEIQRTLEALAAEKSVLQAQVRLGQFQLYLQLLCSRIPKHYSFGWTQKVGCTPAILLYWLIKKSSKGWTAAAGADGGACQASD